MPSGEEKVELTADRVDAIVSVNSHGTGGEKEAHERYTGASSTCLLAATSMFNHAVSPTCDQLTVGGCHVVFAVANINAGEDRRTHSKVPQKRRCGTPSLGNYFIDLS